MGLYDQFQFKEVRPIETYTGAPIDEAIRTAQTLQEKYYKNLAATNTLDIALATQDVTEADRPGYESITQDIKAGIQGIAKKGDYENMGTKITALATRFGADPRIHAMRKSKENYDKYQDQLIQLGPDALDFTTDDMRSWDPETGQIKVFEPRVQAKLPWEEQQHQMVDELTADSVLGDELKRFAGNPQFVYTQEGRALTEDKVRAYIDEYGFDRYKGTREYDQQKQWYLHEMERQGIPIDGDAHNLADERIKQQLLGAGMERVYSDISTKWSSDPLFMAQAKASINQETTYPENSDWARSIYDQATRGTYNEESGITGGAYISAADYKNTFGFPTGQRHGNQTVQLSGNIILNPALIQPDAEIGLEEIGEIREKHGDKFETMSNYLVAKNQQETGNKRFNETRDELPNLIDAAETAGHITPDMADDLRDYTSLDAPSKWLKDKLDISTIASLIPGRSATGERLPEGAALGDALDRILHAVETTKEASVVVHDTRDLYEQHKSSLSDEDQAILTQYGKYLGPEYQAIQKMGQQVRNVTVNAVPTSTNNVMTLPNGRTIGEFVSEMTPEEYEGLFTKAERQTLNRAGMVRISGRGEDGRVQFRFYKELPNDPVTGAGYDNPRAKDEKLTPEAIKMKSSNREVWGAINKLRIDAWAGRRGKTIDSADWNELMRSIETIKSVANSDPVTAMRLINQEYIDLGLATLDGEESGAEE